ncbi:DNA phosphorothioation-associated protein 4 [Desulfuromonas sp. CSMB_57]|uniref:DNA phosphorothioation-associated protein 4 n=1 Tax=Desulfuromonas sp. CSMB_57 TaxID=2807629 RepID=UPI001CD40F5E|nr:DNA phosphorothioation-associated protein 4 [Desulfuromonas sp. CSMB_57]
MKNNKDTLAQVAQQVLLGLDRSASVDEIYTEIVKRNLYTFNTPTPENVLRTAIRQQTDCVERVDSRDEILFEMVGEDVYGLATGILARSRKRAGVGMKRIQRASDKEEIIKSLMSDQVGVFKEIWKLLLFAAQVGVKNNARTPLKAADPGKGIDQTTFGNCPAWPGVLYLMALSETQKSESLSGTQEAEDERVAVFQEYSNGGLAMLQEFFAGRPIDLDGLLAFIEMQREKCAGRLDLDLTI